MSIYLIIYIALSIISVVCAFIAVKADKFALMRAFVIFAIAAGVVLALGNTTGQSGTVYISSDGGSGGISLESLLKIVLYMMPPMIIGAIIVVIGIDVDDSALGGNNAQAGLPHVQKARVRLEAALRFGFGAARRRVNRQHQASEQYQTQSFHGFIPLGWKLRCSFGPSPRCPFQRGQLRFPASPHPSVPHSPRQSSPSRASVLSFQGWVPGRASL